LAIFEKIPDYINLVGAGFGEKVMEGRLDIRLHCRSRLTTLYTRRKSWETSQTAQSAADG
jgi:hypothetical protein